MPDKNVSERSVDQAVVWKKHYEKMHHQFAISLMALILEWSQISKNKAHFLEWTQRRCAGLDSRWVIIKLPKYQLSRKTTFYKSLWWLIAACSVLLMWKHVQATSQKNQLWPYGRRKSGRGAAHNNKQCKAFCKWDLFTCHA